MSKKSNRFAKCSLWRTSLSVKTEEKGLVDGWMDGRMLQYLWINRSKKIPCKFGGLRQHVSVISTKNLKSCSRAFFFTLKRKGRPTDFGISAAAGPVPVHVCCCHTPLAARHHGITCQLILDRWKDATLQLRCSCLTLKTFLEFTF